MPRLAPFLTASVLLHGMVFGIGGRPWPLEAGYDREILSVTLDINRGTAMVARTPPSRSSDSSIPAVSGLLPAAPQEHGHSINMASRTTTDPDESAATRARAQVVSDLARYFYYPPLARMRSWEGRVLLAFHIGQNGLLQDARVARTSGFGVLDEAALNSLRRVERVANTGNARLDLEIPVVYRLTDAH